jgi:hypothetical protein
MSFFLLRSGGPKIGLEHIIGTKLIFFLILLDKTSIKYRKIVQGTKVKPTQNLLKEYLTSFNLA